MVTFCASHVDDCLWSTIEDRMRDSGRGCGNHPIWVESQVDDFQFVDINRKFTPGYSSLAGRSYQQFLREEGDSNSPFELVVLGVPVFCGFWYHVPDTPNVVADSISQYSGVIGTPLLPRLMLEHRLWESSAPRITRDYRYFLRDSERGNLLFLPGSLGEGIDSTLDFSDDSQLVDHEVYHVPGAHHEFADFVSRFLGITGHLLFTRMMSEHRLGEDCNRAEQRVRTEYFVRLIGVGGESFYCGYGRFWDDRYLSGWYTGYEFSGDRFTPLSGPRAMAPYDSWYYSVPGIFPWIRVSVSDGGNTVGLLFKSCSRIVIAGHGIGCTYSIQSSSPYHIRDQGTLWL